MMNNLIYFFKLNKPNHKHFIHNRLVPTYVVNKLWLFQLICIISERRAGVSDGVTVFMKICSLFLIIRDCSHSSHRLTRNTWHLIILITCQSITVIIPVIYCHLLHDLYQGIAGFIMMARNWWWLYNQGCSLNIVLLFFTSQQHFPTQQRKERHLLPVSRFDMRLDICMQHHIVTPDIDTPRHASHTTWLPPTSVQTCCQNVMIFDYRFLKYQNLIIMSVLQSAIIKKNRQPQMIGAGQSNRIIISFLIIYWHFRWLMHFQLYNNYNHITCKYFNTDTASDNAESKNWWTRVQMLVSRWNNKCWNIWSIYLVRVQKLKFSISQMLANCWLIVFVSSLMFPSLSSLTTIFLHRLFVN